MSTEKKRIAVNWALGLASGILVLCAGWMGKTAVGLSNAQAAQLEWNKAQPGEMARVAAERDAVILEKLNARFDEIKDILLKHVLTKP